VVQETCIGVARNVGEFHYDPQKCRFKSWLLNLAAWRVKNQLAKRQRWDERMHVPSADQPATPAGRESSRSDTNETLTAAIERVADLNAENLDALWEEEWRENILKTAIERVRARFSPTQFQIFDLNVIKDWSASDVAKSLGVGLATVYLTKHRVAAAIKKEAARLKKAAERPRALG
jgi:RNA polymerase sigma factor (sigma-70 family)